MKRREFLIGAAAATGLVYSRRSWAQQRDAAKLSRVAIMSLSFNSILRNPSQPDNPARTLDIMDLGEMYADRYGVHNVELQHSHFPAEPVDAGYLKNFRDRLAKTKSQVTNINLEFGPQNISAADPALRQQAVDRTKQWIDYAVLLGCPRIMVNQGAPTEENKADAIAALKAMGDYARTKGIKVGIEAKQVDVMRSYGRTVVAAIRSMCLELGVDWAAEDTRLAARRAIISARTSLGDLIAPQQREVTGG